jgi:hypothetical protein
MEDHPMATCDRRLGYTERVWKGGGSARWRLRTTICHSYGVLWVGTGLAAVLALPFAAELRHLFAYRLAPATPGNARLAVFIASNNIREAAIPVLLGALTLASRRCPIAVGDVLVSATLTVNVALDGLALGAYGPALLRYLPQWPLEWAGLAVGLAAWRRVRAGKGDPCELVLLGLFAAILLCGAAFIETYTVPQT